MVIDRFLVHSVPGSVSALDHILDFVIPIGQRLRPFRTFLRYICLLDAGFSGADGVGSAKFKPQSRILVEFRWFSDNC